MCYNKKYGTIETDLPPLLSCVLRFSKKGDLKTVYRLLYSTVFQIDYKNMDPSFKKSPA
jgi:hypothetical protein